MCRHLQWMIIMNKKYIHLYSPWMWRLITECNPSKPSSSVSDGPLFTSFWRRFPPASAFGQQSPTLRTTLPAQHVRPSGVFCCWPDCPELIARRPSGSGVLCWQLQTVAEDISFFRSTSVFSALEDFYVNALYKFTFDIWHLTVWNMPAKTTASASETLYLLTKASRCS